MKARRVLSRLLPAVALVATISAASSAFATGISLNVTAHGKTFAVSPSLVSTESVVDTAGVTTWIANTVAPAVDHKVENYTSKVDKKRRKLVFSHNDGFSLNQPGSVAAICAALAAQSAVSTPTAQTIALPTNILAKPKKLGRQVLVVKSRRKIYLYDNDKVIKTYRCAIGMSRWPTPSGTFHIGKKVKNPSWTNGYASWSKNMPAYIGPSPNNPLGTRAMYVYTGLKGGHDTGVRFHGVPHSEDWSIGHAASHGCLRMHRKDVEKFFKQVTVGTPVYIIK
jgi:lipoprotein-anchoring transpeptidase ErfK/SrfK